MKVIRSYPNWQWIKQPKRIADLLLAGDGVWTKARVAESFTKCLAHKDSDEARRCNHLGYRHRYQRTNHYYCTQGDDWSLCEHRVFRWRASVAVDMDDVAERICDTHVRHCIMPWINSQLDELAQSKQFEPAIRAIRTGDFSGLDGKVKRGKRMRRRKAKQDELFEEIARRGKKELARRRERGL